MKLHNVTPMSEAEMKHVVGGYEVALGTCGAYIPHGEKEKGPSLGSFNGHYTTYASEELAVNPDFTVHKGISRSSALGMISGVSGAKWCCDNCDKASWYNL